MYSIPGGFRETPMTIGELDEKCAHLLDEGDSFDTWVNLRADIVFQRLMDKKARAGEVGDVLRAIYPGMANDMVTAYVNSTNGFMGDPSEDLNASLPLLTDEVARERVAQVLRRFA